MYYEDFNPGRTFETPSRTVTADDLEIFIRLSGLDNPIFPSKEGAARAGHADRIVPAPLQLSLAMGLCQKAGLFDHVVGVLQFDELRFRRVVHPGHTLTLFAEVLDRKATSRPDRGLVFLGYQMRNQDGETVMTARGTYLFRRRR